MKKNNSLEDLKAELKLRENTKWYESMDGIPHTELFIAMFLFGILPPLLIQQIYRNYKKKKLREKIARLEQNL
jgi:hypothetical protein